jgi:hypothetical protein
VHRVQVGHLHGVAGRFQALHGEVLERSVEGPGLGVGVDDQHIHGDTFIGIECLHDRPPAGILEMNPQHGWY